MTNLSRVLSRVLFAVAFALAGLAVWEKLANLVGYTVLRGRYAPGRMLEFAAIAVLFVIALQVREIRQSVAPKTGA